MFHKIPPTDWPANFVSSPPIGLDGLSMDLTRCIWYEFVFLRSSIWLLALHFQPAATVLNEDTIPNYYFLLLLDTKKLLLGEKIFYINIPYCTFWIDYWRWWITRWWSGEDEMSLWVVPTSEIMDYHGKVTSWFLFRKTIKKWTKFD